MNADLSTLRRGALFLAAGGLNTCFGYAAFACLLWLTGSKQLAVLLGTAAGVLFNFGTCRSVFSATGFGRLPHFVAFYVLVLAANLLLLRLLTQSGLNAYVAQAIIILLITPFSFVAMRSLVFPRRPATHS